MQVLEKNAVSAPAAPAGSPRRAPDSVRTGIILVVDDNVAIADMMCEFLRAQGLKCLRSTGAINALSLWSEHKNDIRLVITDLQMPEMNGDELVARLQRDQPELRYIIMSGTPEIATILLEEGVNFFQKPFSFVNVFERVDALLRVK